MTKRLSSGNGYVPYYCSICGRKIDATETYVRVQLAFRSYKQVGDTVPAGTAYTHSECARECMGEIFGLDTLYPEEWRGN